VAFTSRSGHTQTALAEINITPLVDVVLVLLVIFMITAPVLQSGIAVNVPKTKTVHEITQQRTVITINKDSEVFMNDKPVNLNDLPGLLRQQSADPNNDVIYLRADEKVSFGTFATLMDAVKQSGITHISVVTQPTESSPVIP
jgi:biopolymer transport protein TolR